MSAWISVIMPVFNRSTVINESISSVLEQDYPDYELIIIDDGSTDGLEQKIQQLKTPVVRYCRLSRNAGQAYARNVGVSIAKGEILAFQDSDDVWYPHRMRRQVEAMQGYDFSFCAFEKGGVRWPAGSVDIDRLYHSILSTPLIGTPTLFCTKSAFEKAGGFQVAYRCFEDYDLSLRLSKRFRGYYIDEVMLRAGERPVHVGGDENINEGLRVRCDLFMRYYRDIRENHLEQVWMDGLLRFQRLCDPVVFNYEMGKIRCFLSGMQEDGFLNAQTAAYAQDLFSHAVGLGIDFKLNAPALGMPPPSYSDLTIGQEGKSCEELLSFFKKKVIPSCTNFYNELKTSGRVQRYAHIELKDKGLSNRFIRGVHQVLNQALEQAVSEKLIVTNPASGCRLPKIERKEMKVLLPEQIGAYLKEADRCGLLPAYYLELTSGLRRGELLALLWTDLDVENMTISVTKQVNRINGELKVSQPKTRNSVRTIPIPKQAVDLLVAEHEKHPDSPYMFPSPKTGTMYDPDSFRHTHEKILAAAGIEHIRFHDLRHPNVKPKTQNFYPSK